MMLQHARPGTAQASRPVAGLPAAASLDQLVSSTLLPQLDYFFARLLAEGKDLVIDGTRAFNGGDKFLPGKIAMGMSYLLVNTPRDDPRFNAYLEGYRRIAGMTLDEDNESWGIYYYLSALDALRRAGLLEAALSADTLAQLCSRLDWRGFVAQPAFTLIGLPTNYFGVAFSIARLRYLLGWDEARPSEILLERMVHHYETYSGEFGFSDETDGEGRFDRYSILLIGEICQRFIQTGLPVTSQLKTWLRRAVDVILPRLNTEGHGFDFGRSIGAYGDTAFLEVLSAAAKLDVLSTEECDMAYTFAMHASSKYAFFWYDRDTRSVRLWGQDRRTDAYRGKHRILGENLSLLHQHIYTNALWNEVGYRGRPASPGYQAWLAQLPRASTTWFARGEYDRALVGFRDGAHLIDLPIINGGITLHHTNPYYPIPFSNALVQGAADTDFPQLMPRIFLADGSQLTATAFFRSLRVQDEGEALCVSWDMDELNRLGERAPVKDARLQAHIAYRLESGRIHRQDRYLPTQPLEGVEVVMEFASFSRGATVEGGRVRFTEGAVTGFDTTGFHEVSVQALDEATIHCAPMGRMHTLIRCRVRLDRLAQPLHLGWTIHYR